jgi:hypothetical protein
MVSLAAWNAGQGEQKGRPKLGGSFHFRGGQPTSRISLYKSSNSPQHKQE